MDHEDALIMETQAKHTNPYKPDLQLLQTALRQWFPQA